MAFTNQRSPSAPIVYGDISIDPSDGSIVGNSGSFGSLTIDGEDFNEILQAQDDRDTDQDSRLDGIDNYLDTVDTAINNTPRVISRMRVSGKSPTFTTTTRIFTYTLAAKAGHAYVMFCPALQIGLVDARMGNYYGYTVTVKTNDSRPNSYFRFYDWATVAGNQNYGVMGQTIYLDRTTFTNATTYTIWADLRGSGSHGGFYIDQSDNEVNFVIVDLGKTGGTYKAIPLASMTGDVYEPPADDPEPPTPSPPKPVTKTYTGKFTMSAYANYSTDSGQKQSWPNLLRQSTMGVERAGVVTFTGKDQYGRSISDLSKSNITVSSATVTLGAKGSTGESVAWYYSSGGIGRIYYHTTSTLGNTVPGMNFIQETGTWKNGQTKDIPITGAALTALKGGSFRGVAISGKGKGNQYTYHGQLPATATLTVVYKVTT